MAPFLGIRYLYLPIPNKEAVYEEHLALILRKNKGYDSYSQIVDHLRAGGRFTDFIDTKELLVRKNEAQLYFRTDSHWNYATARPWSTGRSSRGCSNGFPTSGRCGRRTGRNGSRVFPATWRS